MRTMTPTKNPRKNRLWQRRTGKVQRNRLNRPYTASKPQKTDRELIAAYLEELGIDWKNADQSKAAIRSITQLEPEEANYPEIVGRLSVKVQEQREAKAEAERLKKTKAAAPQ
jgi:hypothetical protein